MLETEYRIEFVDEAIHRSSYFINFIYPTDKETEVLKYRIW